MSISEVDTFTPVHPNGAPLDLRAIERITWSGSGNPTLIRGAGHSIVTEQYGLLAHRIRRARLARPLQTLLVTSAVPREGKTTAAVNLASILARNGSSVLLLDADLRAPSLAKTMGLPSNLPGLGDVLSQEARIERCLRCVIPVGLYFLPAGRPSGNPLPQLQSGAFENLLARARQAFEWVVIDSPPLTPVADAHCLASLAEGILMVVRWGLTPRRELDRALDTLTGLPLLGLVLNAYDEPYQKEYYSYYARSVAARPQLALPAAPDPADSQPDHN